MVSLSEQIAALSRRLHLNHPDCPSLHEVRLLLEGWIPQARQMESHRLAQLMARTSSSGYSHDVCGSEAEETV